MGEGSFQGGGRAGVITNAGILKHCTQYDAVGNHPSGIEPPTNREHVIIH
jgi:hypothetical protein